MAKIDDPKCDHDRHGVIVTNQPGRYEPGRAHASTWVCDDPRCVVDAMAWVQLVTKEKAWRRAGTTGEWVDTMPELALVADIGENE